MKKEVALTFSAKEIIEALQQQYPEACGGTNHTLFLLVKHGGPTMVSSSGQAVTLRFVPPESQYEKN